MRIPARGVREQIKPEHEKAALLVEKFKHLEQIVEKGGRSRHLAQNHLEKLADKMSRQEDVMQYVRERDKPMQKQINEMAKEQQKEHSLDREIEF